MGNQSFGFPVHQAQERGADERRGTLCDFALKLAARHYTHEEFCALDRDLEAGRIDVRLYDDGLVLMRVADEAKALT
jgi:hypothetical protein